MEKAGKLWCDFARHLAEGVQDKFHSQNLSVQICTKPLYILPVQLLLKVLPIGHLAKKGSGNNLQASTEDRFTSVLVVPLDSYRNCMAIEDQDALQEL